MYAVSVISGGTAGCLTLRIARPTSNARASAVGWSVKEVGMSCSGAGVGVKYARQLECRCRHGAVDVAHASRRHSRWRAAHERRRPQHGKMLRLVPLCLFKQVAWQATVKPRRRRPVTYNSSAVRHCAGKPQSVS